MRTLLLLGLAACASTEELAPASDPIANKIYGEDQRRTIEDTAEWPARAVARIDVAWRNGETAWCTGTLIGRKSVLTAGSCVYSQTGGWAQSVTVSPGKNYHREPFGRATAVAYDTVSGWTMDHDYAEDYALVTLDRNLGDAAGWLGVASLPDDTLDQLATTIHGYSGQDSRQLISVGRVEDMDSKVLYHRIDAADYEAGAALHGRPGPWHDYVYGVNTAVAWNGLTDDTMAVRINDGRLTQIQAWMSARAGLPVVGGNQTGWLSTALPTFYSPTSVRYSDLRYDTFARAFDGSVKWRTSTGGVWTNLGGQTSAKVAAVARKPGQIDLFVRGESGALWTKAQNSAGVWWPGTTQWANLGGTITSAPVAVSDAPDRLHVFARGGDGELVWYRWAGGAWSAPVGLGKKIIGEPSATSWGPDRVDVVACGETGWLYSFWNGQSWAPWVGSGGGGGPCHMIIVAPEPGVLEIFSADYYIAHTRSENGGPFGPWLYIGEGMGTEIGAIVRKPGQIDLFARAPDGRAVTKARNTDGSWWPAGKEWYPLGGDILSDPDVASLGPNHLAVIVRGSDNVIRTRTWNGGSW